MPLSSTLRLSTSGLTGRAADVELLVTPATRPALDLAALGAFFTNVVADDAALAAGDTAGARVAIERDAAVPAAPAPWIIVVAPPKGRRSPLHRLAERERVSVIEPADPKALTRVNQAEIKARARGVPIVVVAEIEASGTIDKAVQWARLIDAAVCGVVTGVLDPNLRYRGPGGREARAMRDVIDELDCVIVPGAGALGTLRPRFAAIIGADLPAAPAAATLEREVLIVVDGAATRWRSDARRQAENWQAAAVRGCKDAKVKFAVIGHDLEGRRASALGISVPSDEKLLAEIAASRTVVTGASEVAVWAAALGKRVIHLSLASAPSLPLQRPFGDTIDTAYRWQDVRDRIRQSRQDDAARANFVAHAAGRANDVDAALVEVLTALGSLQAVSRAVPRAQVDRISQTNVVIWSRMPHDRYSGGRYHAWIMAEALAEAGFGVAVATDHVPLCARDFQRYPAHHRIRLIAMNAADEATAAQPADIVFLAPGMEKTSQVYIQAVLFARRTGARLGMLNYESPNWFNSMTPKRRDEALWENWFRFSAFCSAIVSTAHESQGWAEDYYTEQFVGGFQETVWAGINSQALDAAPVVAREDRIAFFFPRIGHSEHKGWDAIPRLISPALAGATLSILGGAEPPPIELQRAMEARGRACGVEVEYHFQLDDRAKFDLLRRSRLLLFTSTFEGYGYPPLEALAAGTPCVAFDLPVLRETCGDHLRYAPPGDWVALGDALVAAWRDPAPLAPAASERALFVAGFGNYVERLRALVGRVLETPFPWNAAGSERADLEQVRSHFLGDLLSASRDVSLAQLVGAAEARAPADYAATLREAVAAGAPALVDVTAADRQRKPRLLFVFPGDPTASFDEPVRLLWELFRHAKDNGAAIDVVWIGAEPTMLMRDRVGDGVRCLRLEATAAEPVDAARLQQFDAIVQSLRELELTPGDKLDAYAEDARRSLVDSRRGSHRDDLVALLALVATREPYDAILVSRSPGLDQIEPLTKAHDRPLVIAATDRRELRAAAADRRADYHVHYVDSNEATSTRRTRAAPGLLGVEEDAWLLGRDKSALLGAFDRRQIAIVADPHSASAEEAERFLVRHWQRLLELSGPHPILLFGTRLDSLAKLPFRCFPVDGSVAAVQAQLQNVAVAIDFTALAGADRSSGWIQKVMRLAGVPLCEVRATGHGQSRAAVRWIETLLDDRDAWIAASKHEIAEAEERCATGDPFAAFDRALALQLREQTQQRPSAETLAQRQEVEMARATADQAIVAQGLAVRPRGADVLWALASAATADGEAEIASEYLRRAILANPDHLALLERYAAAMLQAGRADEARGAFHRIAARAPLDPRPLVDLARLALDEDDAAAARRHARLAVDLDPLDVAALDAFAAALDQLGDAPDDLAWAARRLAALDPDEAGGGALDRLLVAHAARPEAVDAG